MTATLELEIVNAEDQIASHLLMRMRKVYGIFHFFAHSATSRVMFGEISFHEVVSLVL